MRDDPLLQPYDLKHIRLRNRIITTPHEPSYSSDGMPKERYRAYHVERAKGGVAMTMTAGSACVAPDSASSFGNLEVYKDEIVPWMRDLADECHEHGAAVMIQLTHLGRRTRWDRGDWLPIVSPSRNRETAHRAAPKLIEEWDIARIVKDFGDAVERMKAAGLDGAEIEAYGHLIEQFWSPALNDLSGEYSGSLDNRLRFVFQILKEMRARVGENFILGVRYSIDDLITGGFGKEEGLEISHRLKDSGLVDYLNIVRGHVDSDPGQVDMIGLMGMPTAPHLDHVGEIRRAINFPVFHAARIADVATARHAIAGGKVDMVGMVRTHLADPHIVRKTIEGREDEIRPCVGAMYCLDRIYQGGSAYCIHNAATGRELSMPHIVERADNKRRVTIVGAGPAGLEAARVAGERGHDVIVFEAANEPGGQIRLQALAPGRRDMMGIIDWRMSRCGALGVEFRFNTLAGLTDVLATNPDIVVVATGGLPYNDFLEEGSDLAISSWDVISGDVKPSGNILLFDNAGDHAAMQAAIFLTAAGSKVEMMSPYSSISPEVMGLSLTTYMRALQNRDIAFSVALRLRGLRRDGNRIAARIGSDYFDGTSEKPFDHVVLNNGTLPLDELYFELKPLSVNKGEVHYPALIKGLPQPFTRAVDGFRLYRIGDAVSSRNTHAAIYDALRLVKDF